MAQPPKATAARPGPSAQPPAIARAKQRRGGSPLRAALTVFLLFCVLGAAPLALGGEALGIWRLPSVVSLDALPWLLNYDTPLAKPTQMVANVTLRVTSTPGGAVAIATLEPGFVVSVARYATDAGERWAQITWGGPTHATGGSGWILASGLIGANASTHARAIGDLGALSPAFGQAASTLTAGSASALYFPAMGASYHTAEIETAQPLGTQVIPLVLAALYAKGITASQPNATSGPPQIARDLASGNAQALTFDYALVGDAAGMDSFLTEHHVTGMQFVAHEPMLAKGSVRSLLLFYTTLLGGSLLNQHDRAEMIGLLSSANSGQSAAPQSVVGTGELLATPSSASATTPAIVTGILTPSNGAQVVVVALFYGPNDAATVKQEQTYFGRLIPLLQG